MAKKIMTLLLVVVMILGLCACSPESVSPTPTVQPTKSIETEPTVSPSAQPTPKADLTLNDFTIIYPTEDISVASNVKQIATELRTAIVTQLGAKIKFYSDTIDEDSGLTEHTHEILIGSTNRNESLDAIDGLNLRYYDYVIKYEGTKLVINGGSEEAIADGVEYFISDILNHDMTTVEGCKQLTQSDIHYVYDSNIKRFYIGGEYIRNFCIVSDDSDTANYVANEILIKTGEKISVGSIDNAQKHEIIIGECDRDEYRSVIANMHGRDYAVEVVNGKLVIAGATARGTELALEKFVTNYLNQNCEKFDITLENDFNYDHVYPITSLKLCGRDISDFVIVTSSNNIGTAKKLSSKLEEMTGEKIKIVTDAAKLYDAAIVLSKSRDENAKSLLDGFDNDTVMIISDGAKIYMGTNSISYGDSPAINAFISDILGYDTVLGKAKNSTVDVAEINYKTNITDNLEQFIVTQYHGIRQKFILNEDGSLNTARIDENKEAGMNVIDLNFDTETNKKALEYCSSVGLRCTVYDWRISNLVYSATLPENWVDTIESVVNDYSPYTATYFYGICDEPTTEKFERLRLICTTLEELDPARRQYVNHFPTGEDWYDEFLQIVGTDILSYDRYVFKEERDYVEFFYTNLEAARNVALKYGADYMAIHLLIEHGNTDGGPIYRYIGEEELSWQTYNSLAYGVSEVSYFTYWSPDNDPNSTWYNNDAMISASGEKTAHYYEIQRIMQRFRVIADVLVDKLSIGVFHTQKYIDTHNQETTLFEGFDTIKEIIANDITIGMFEDDMMLIANGSYTDSMDVEIVTDSDLLIFDPATKQWHELSGNKFTIAVGSGELIKIVK